MDRIRKRLIESGKTNTSFVVKIIRTRRFCMFQALIEIKKKGLFGAVVIKKRKILAEAH